MNSKCCVRERIVGELTRRRAKLRGQVEQLQAGRDRLLDAFQVVRDALDEKLGLKGKSKKEKWIEVAKDLVAQG